MTEGKDRAKENEDENEKEKPNTDTVRLSACSLMLGPSGPLIKLA
jgi:hypothetical protein